MLFSSRTDFQVKFADGSIHEYFSTIRDFMEFKKVVKNPTGDLEDALRMAFIAAKRLDITDVKLFDEWLDVCVEMAVVESPPLVTTPSPEN